MTYIYLLGQSFLMGIENIIGRGREKSILEAVLKSPDPEFVAVYGRRRVGKTHLVSEFFDSCICFEIIGIHNASLRDQLDNFSHSLKKACALWSLVSPFAPL